VGFGRAVVFGSNHPTGRVSEQAADQLRVKGVASFVCFDASEQRKADQSEVADEIESFVAAELIEKAKWPIHYAIVGEDDGIIERTPTDQAHRAQRLNIPFKAEGARASEQIPESVWKHDHFNLLLTDERMGKIHVALNAKFLARVNADAAILFDDFHGLDYFEIAATAAEPTKAGLLQELQEWLCGAIENGNFNGVDIDIDVVKLRGIDCGQKMLGGGYQNALLHEAGGVTDAGDIAAAGLDGKVIKIGAAEHDARVGRSGIEAKMAKDTGVEASAFG